MTAKKLTNISEATNTSIDVELVNSLVSSHLRECYVCFGDHGEFVDYYSSTLWKYFDEDLKGKNFFEFFGVNDADKESISLLFDLLRDQTVQFSTLVDLLPESVRSPELNCELKLSYVCISPDENGFNGFAVIIKDLTETKILIEEAEEAKSKAEMIQRIVADPVSFQSFVNSIRRLYLQMKTWQSEYSSDDSINNFCRTLHTLKGNASLFSARSLVGFIHRVEDVLASHKNMNKEELVELVNEIGESLEAKLLQFQEENDGLLGSLRRIVKAAALIDINTMAKLENMVERINDKDLTELYASSIKTDSLNALFLPVKMSILSFANKQEKKVTVVLQGGATRVPVKRFRPILEVLTNVFLNCVDHGIENPEERVAAGKSETGKIDVHFEFVNRNNQGWLGINISDDGCGIDIPKLKEKLMEEGYPANEWSRQKIAESIFMSGMTTRDEASGTSGRGLGMAAVKETIEAEGGKIHVDSHKGHGTRFRFLIPFD